MEESKIEKIEKPSKKNIAKDIMDLLEENEIILFRDQFNDGYIVINGDWSNFKKINSTDFRQWLLNFYFEETGRTTNEAIIKSVSQLLEYKAKQSKKKHYLFVRVARCSKNFIWYDLGDNRFVVITPTTWEILSDDEIKRITEREPEILIRRFKHQKIQCEPEKGGNIDDIFKFINIQDDEKKLLFKVYLVSAFIWGFPHPVLAPHGPQGAAKTTAQKIAKEIIDPSSVKTIGLPRDIKSLIQTASHHWFLCIDNISFLSNEFSDVLCRICTGEGSSDRVLYTDDDDFIRNFQHIITINGINQIIHKPDLLDRSLLLPLSRISEEERLDEETLWGRFNEAKPKILGAIFDILSKALREYQSVNLVRKPRMADFAKWGCAISRPLGYSDQDFLRAYRNNIGDQNEEAIESSPIAQVIIDYMADKTCEKDTPTGWLERLDLIAEQLKLKDEKEYPRTQSWLWRRIVPVIPNLEAIGIKIKKESENNKRYITITKTSDMAPIQEVEDKKDLI